MSSQLTNWYPYLASGSAAALPLGLQPRSCAEPRWPPQRHQRAEG